MKKRIGLGRDIFKNLIEEECYYIDKTKFIEEIFKEIGKTILFTRPRISGKTLNITMLKSFFDVKKADENRKLFKNLYIENSPIMKEQGKYPVIFLSMFHIDSEESFKYRISDLYGDFYYIRESLDERELKIFDEIYFKESENISDYSLKPLMKMLKEYYNEKVILLIDEYDAPLVKGHKKGKYEEIYNLLDSFYGKILKENEYLKFAVVIGVENFVFNSVNNICSYGVLDKKYSEYFGVTEKELDKVLNDFDQSKNKKEIEKWYGGYKFGENKIYNVCSILKFLSSENEFKVYWKEGGSENYFIKYMIEKFSYVNFLEKLANGENLEVDLKDVITEFEIENGSAFFTFMVSRGFLTVEEKIDYKTYLVKIPNQEVSKFFTKLFINSFKEKSKNNLNLIYL